MYLVSILGITIPRTNIKTKKIKIQPTNTTARATTISIKIQNKKKKTISITKSNTTTSANTITRRRAKTYFANENNEMTISTQLVFFV